MVELIFWAVIGTLSGIIFGIIPGAGPFIAIATLYPFLDNAVPISIMMCYVCVLIASNYTNSVTAILYGIPGDATAISTAKNGHRLFSKGFGSVAVTSNAISSTAGVICAVTAFILALPYILNVFKFYNSIIQTFIICAAILIVTFLTNQHKLVTVLLFCIGGVLAKVGIDPITFDSFLTFGNSYLALGIPFASVMIGMYIVPELTKIRNIKVDNPKSISKYAIGKGTTVPTLIGSFLGFWCGLIPGVTNILGSYVSANIVKRFFRKPILKSIAAAEAANNSGALSSLLPLLILAIPITGSEVLVYYLMLENGFTFSAENTVKNLYNIIYIIPSVTLFCLWLSWYGFNLLGSVAYFYKKFNNIINLILFTFISAISILVFPIQIWMFICILCLSVIGYIIRHWNTSPVIYGFFLSDLFYESIIRTLVILT